MRSIHAARGGHLLPFDRRKTDVCVFVVDNLAEGDDVVDCFAWLVLLLFVCFVSFFVCLCFFAFLFPSLALLVPGAWCLVAGAAAWGCRRLK